MYVPTIFKLILCNIVYYYYNITHHVPGVWFVCNTSFCIYVDELKSTFDRNVKLTNITSWDDQTKNIFSKWNNIFQVYLDISLIMRFILSFTHTHVYKHYAYGRLETKTTRENNILYFILSVFVYYTHVILWIQRTFWFFHIYIIWRLKFSIIV